MCLYASYLLTYDAVVDCTHHNYCCACELTLSLSDTLIVHVTYSPCLTASNDSHQQLHCVKRHCVCLMLACMSSILTLNDVTELIVPLVYTCVSQ